MVDKQVTRLHRVTDLFVTGREIVLSEDGPGGSVLVWVSKLNSFQRGDAQRDGSAGQARRMATLADDSEEMRLLMSRIADYTDDDLIDAILAPRTTELYMAGRDDVHADPEWTERLALVERADALAADGSYQTEDEAKAVGEVNAQYLAAVNAARDKRRADAREDLRGEGREHLLKEYRAAYRRMLGFEAFQDEFSRTEIWYALRDCTAVATKDGYDHFKCTHLRLLPNRAAVAELPESLVDTVTTALNDLNMPPATAGNSAAPATSSGSSEQPSKAEDSAPSTPAAT